MATPVNNEWVTISAPPVEDEWEDVWTDISADKIGFGEAFIERPLEKIPFSPVGPAKSAALISASKRLQADDYPAFISEVDKFAEAMEPMGGYTPTFGPTPARKPLDVGMQAKRAKQEDIDFLTTYFEEEAEKGRRGYTTLGRVGQILSEMPAFVTEFITTGGLQKLGSASAKRGATTLLRRHATTTAGKAAIATSGFAVGTAARAAGMPHRAANAILKRQIPQDIEISDDGEVKITGPVESTFTSIWKGLGDHYIEIASEQAGEHIAPFISGGFKKLPFMGKLMGAVQKRWLKLNPTKTISDFTKKVGTTTGFHGVLSEVGEEYLGDATRAIVDVDHFGVGEDAGMLERIGAAVRADTENLPAMLIAFSVPGVATGVANIGVTKQRIADKKRQAELDLITGLEINAPTQIATAEGNIGYEDDFFMEKWYQAQPKYNFDTPGTMKYFTPKWLLNRMLGTEILLEDVVKAEEAHQLERLHLNGWVSKLIPKLKKEKDLTRLPEILPEEIEKEIEADMADIAASIPLGSHKLASLDLSLRDLSDEELESAYEQSESEVIDLETQFDENLELEKNIDFVQTLSAAQDRLSALENERFFRMMAEAPIEDIVDEFRDLDFKMDYKGGRLKMILLIYAVKQQGLEKEFQQELGQRARGSRDVRTLIERQLDDLRSLAKEIRGLNRKITGEEKPLREPIKAEETKAHILQKKIDSKKPVHIMRDLLDTYEDAPAFLNKNETRIFNQVRELTRYLRQRANLVRERMGLEPISNVEGYITHWMDSAANRIVNKDVPIHSGYMYWLMKGLPKEVKNPTAMKRKVKGQMEKYFSKDLGRLLRIMTAYDLKDIYLMEPYQAAWDELQNLREARLIPDSTYNEVEKFLLYDIRKHQAPMDKAFNRTIKKPVDLLNKMLPVKKVIDDPARSVFSTMRRLGHVSGLGLRLRPANRNLGQRLLLTDLYRTSDYAKAQAVAFRLAEMPTVKHPQTGEDVPLIDLVREQDWYKLALRKFEDTVTAVTGVERTAMYLYSRTHIGNLFLSNVEVAAITGYFDWENMYRQSKDVKSRHFKNALKQAKRLKVQVAELLTPESDMMWNVREAVRRTQWEYFSISMPAFYRSQFNRAVGMFQSWWMNYFFNHSREMINQSLTGRNSLGRLLTPGGRLRAAKGLGTITAIGKVAEGVFGLEMLKYLFLPLPGYMPPIPSLIIGFIQFFGADDEKDRKAAWEKIKRGLKFWIPFSAFGRDLNKLLSGEYSISDFLLYKKEKK